MLRDARAGRGLDARGVTFNAELARRLARELFVGPITITRQWKPNARFDYASFPDETDFTFCVFPMGVSFRGASFGAASMFFGSSFPYGVDFTGARFGEACTFARAVFPSKPLTAFLSIERSHRSQVETFGAVSFARAILGPNASFAGAAIGSLSTFEDAQIGDSGTFVGAQFGDGVRFIRTLFGEGVSFSGARFAAGSRFDKARFGADADFSGVTLGNGATFRSSAFGDGVRLGPLVCTGRLILARVTFTGSAEVAAEASDVSCRGLQAESRGTLRFRCDSLDLEGLHASAPCTIASADDVDFPPPSRESELQNVRAMSRRPVVRSLRGADVSNIVLADVDLASCEFAGAHNLDRLRLEGIVDFREPPNGWAIGWSLPPLWYWSRRKVIAEEHHWRSARRKGRRWEGPSSAVAAIVATDDADVQRTVDLLRASRDRFEALLRCKIPDDALTTIVVEAGQHFPERHLSEKAFDLLELSCITVRVEVDPPLTVPSGLFPELEEAIEDVRQEKDHAIEALDFERAASLRDRERKLLQKRAELEAGAVEERLAEERTTGGEPRELTTEMIEKSVRIWSGSTAAPGSEIGGSASPVVGHRSGTQRLSSSQISEIYRALRKGREDNKDSPGAADFYYGEMEMRRHTRTTPWGDRVILSLYWLFSGYGLRAMRAVVALCGVTAAFGFLFAKWGFVAAGRNSYISGVLHSIESATLLPRGTSRPLTQWGEAFQVILKFIGPALLALAVLSLRGRTRR